jgi:hypothetical protein
MLIWIVGIALCIIYAAFCFALARLVDKATTIGARSKRAR